MDILSHALWSSVAAKAANKKFQNNIDIWRAGFWGAFPDLFAFTPLLLVIIWQVFNGANLYNLPRSGAIGQLTGFLYPLSHSFLIFLIVFGIVSLFMRKPFWEMGGWGLHILLDIGTHPADFYPTRFLWPFSDFTIGGVSWRTPEFLIINYLLLGVFFFIFRKEKNPAPFTLTRKILTAILVVIAIVSTYATFPKG